MESKTKKIIFAIVVILVAFGIGFTTAYFIAKHRYTKSVDKLEQLLGNGKQSAEDLYKELEQRIKELDGFRATADQLNSNVSECINIVEQSGLAIEQLGRTVESIGSTSSNIGDTIKQLKEGQSRVKQYVAGLEANNRELATKLGQLQSCSGK